MHTKHIFNLFFSFIILFLIVVSCANPIAPTGGPKDESPPEFLGSEPVNRARNFKSEKIDIVFDEFVVLKELNKQLLVSPPMQTKLNIKTKGKGVRIKFDKEEILADSTTYTIYFGDAIVDLHENNPLSNFQYVFSTGADIDSLSIRGKVLNAQHSMPEEGVFVCLYLDNNDTLSLDELPQKVRPYYVAKTNKEGFFEINNIRNDSYLIFAVSDANANYFNDLPNESIAFANDLVFPEEVFDFIPDTIPIDTSNVQLMDSLWANYAVQVTKEEHVLLLYEPQDSVQRVINKDVLDNKRMHFEFKYPLKDSVKFTFINSDSTVQNIKYIEDYSLNMDSLDLWFFKPVPDTIRLKMEVDTLKADTILVLLNAKLVKESPNNMRGRSGVENQVVEEQTISYTSNFKSEFPYFSKGIIEFSTPINVANFQNCSLVEDSISVHYEIRFIDTVKRKLLIEYAWKEGVKYSFQIPDQALTDIYGIKNDSISAKFKTTEESNYGELQIRLNLPPESTSPWIVQLYKGSEDKEKIFGLASVQDSIGAIFSHLVDDKYRIKALEDRDGNGRWSSGDYARKILPEKVYYFPNVIEIKAGWKVEEVWEITDKALINKIIK